MSKRGSHSVAGSPGSLDKVGPQLASRLRTRFSELEAGLARLVDEEGSDRREVVDRRTVANRIRAVEELIGRPLGDFATDLETALRLAD